MINVNELRIGNFVSNGNPVTVEHYFLQDSFADFDPIPITPEILEKCGFENFAFEYIHESGVSLENMRGNDGPGQPDYFYLSFVFKNASVEIKHLHQLQNLYFALTGEELKVNL